MIFGPIVKCPASVSFPAKITAKFRNAAAASGVNAAAGAAVESAAFRDDAATSIFEEINAQPLFYSPDHE